MTSTPWAKDEGKALAEAVAAVRADVAELSDELSYPDRDGLEASDEFREAVERLTERYLPRDLLLRLARHRDEWVSRVAVCALAGRTDLPPDWPSYVMRRLPNASWGDAWLLLRTLEEVEEPVIARVLARLKDVEARDAAELIAARHANGREVVTVETFRRDVKLSNVGAIEGMFEEAGKLIPQARAAFEAWLTTTPDAFLRLHPLGGSDEAEASAFAATLASMYVAWGELRGMLVRRLDIEDGGDVFAVSGLGAATILAPEAGIHVLELPGDDEQRTVDRVAVGVELAPWRPTRGHGDEPPEAAAREALAEVSVATQVVRRYRYDPSPLVRDSVRRFRTGRLDRVLGGDFDVF
jgi:hypothetical protein